VLRRLRQAACKKVPLEEGWDLETGSRLFAEETSAKRWPPRTSLCGHYLARHSHAQQPHFFSLFARKPISLPFTSGGAINSRIASNSTLNWTSYFFSRASSFLASSGVEVRSRRSVTKVRAT